MIRALRLWWARKQLRMIEDDIRRTGRDLEDAAMALDLHVSQALRRHLHRLSNDRRMVRQKIEILKGRR